MQYVYNASLLDLEIVFVYGIFQNILGTDRTLKPNLCGILRKVLSEIRQKGVFQLLMQTASPVEVDGNKMFL